LKTKKNLATDYTDFTESRKEFLDTDYYKVKSKNKKVKSKEEEFCHRFHR
jgi:hypothetical protein